MLQLYSVRLLLALLSLSLCATIMACARVTAQPTAHSIGQAAKCLAASLIIAVFTIAVALIASTPVQL
jgi:hypothetical protein